MPGTDASRSTLRLVALLALVLMAARIAYLLWCCPYNLVEDEAFYWEWSLRPDWSYATKGPGIAWAIWLSTHLFGTSEASIRLVAAVSGFVASVAIGALTRDVATFMGRDAHDTRRAAILATILFNHIPVFQSTSLLCTIDGPFFACWALAAWAGWNAIARGHAPAWLALGLALGLGFLFKYTILLIIPGLLAAWFILPRPTRTPNFIWPLLGALALLLGLLPVVIWNSQHDWQTVRHLLGHLGLPGGDTIRATNPAPHEPWSPLWMPELLVTQIAFIGPCIVACVAAGWRVIARAELDPRSHRAGVYLLACALPILLFYLGVTFIAEAEGNWPVAGWITLVPLVSLWFTHAATAKPVHARGLLRTTIIVGVIICLIGLRLDLLRDALSLASPTLASTIPVGRLTAAPVMARDAESIVTNLRAQTGREPIVIAQHYGRASRLRFYLKDRPVVHCASQQTGGRKVQQDYWPDTDLRDPKLLGRPALLVGGDPQGLCWLPAFERITPIGHLEGETKKGRPVFTGINYRGWP